MLDERAGDERAIDVDRRKGGRNAILDVDAPLKSGSIRVEDFRDHLSQIDRCRAGDGRRREAGELRRDLPEQPDLAEDRADAAFENRSQRLARGRRGRAAGARQTVEWASADS